MKSPAALASVVTPFFLLSILPAVVPFAPQPALKGGRRGLQEPELSSSSSSSPWLQQRHHQHQPTPAFTSLYRPSSSKRTASKSDDTNNEDDDEKCTIQILMSDTGGGHRASANALRDAFDVLYPGQIECDIVDIYTDYGAVWPFNDYVHMYKLMAHHPWTWDVFYHYGATPVGEWINNWLLETTCFDAFKQCLARPSGNTNKNKRRADMVVSVHPLCQDLPLKILADLDSNGATRNPAARTTPFATVVTDLGSAHPTWFDRGVDKCFVPSDALNKVARDRGLQRSQIIQHGLPIREGFWAMDGSESHHDIEEKLHREKQTPEEAAAEKIALREKLGLDPDLPTALVVGGGDGMGGIVQIGKALGERLGHDGASQQQTTQLIIVCGKNEKAKAELSAMTFGDDVKVQVQGFVHNMDEWMKASDCLVTKAGPGSIAEASICGLPCMMFSYLPGQEEGNIPFVEDSGFGRYSGDPSVIADTVSSWLESPHKLHKMQDAALEASRPMATLDIALDLANMVFDEKKKQKHGKKQQQEQPVAARSPLPI